MRKEKWIAIMLVVVSALTMFACGTSSDQKEEEHPTKNTVFAGKKMEKYVDWILNKEYVYYAVIDGNHITYGENGDNNRFVVVPGSMVNLDTTAVFMQRDEDTYLITGVNYTELTDSEIKKLKLETLFSNATLDNFTSSSFVGEGTDRIDGEEFSYEDYFSVGDQIKTRYYFDSEGNLIYKSTISTKGKIGKKIPVGIYEINPRVFDIENGGYTYIEQQQVTKAPKKETTKTVK